MSHKSKMLSFTLNSLAGSLLVLAAGILTVQPALGDQTETQCTEHEVDQNKCFICDASIRDRGRLWCKEHSRYEDRCWICHPDLKEADRLFCEEHGLYEDECFFCHPEVTKSDEDSGKNSLKDQPVLFCNEHNVPETECGICQPQRAAELATGQSLKIRFSSAQSADKAGIRTSILSKSLSTPKIEAFGEVKYNQNALARITPLAEGVIQRVLVDVGDQVKLGDILVEINSAEIAETKAAFLAAIADALVKGMASKREETLVNEKISAARDYQEAKASYDIALLTQSTARQRLLNYGFTNHEIEQIEKTHDSSSMFAVKAPFSGTLIERDAVVGEFINRGDHLFSVADLAEMWLELSIPAHQANLVQRGLDVEAAFDRRASIVAEGKLVWVATSIDERSRMLRARAVVPNKDGKLKAGMFGKAGVVAEQDKPSFCIPKDAIQRLDGNEYLFVKEEEDLYALRRVEVGATNGSTAEIIAGINENDRVVTQGSFIVLSEFFKSRLGAGCTDD